MKYEEAIGYVFKHGTESDDRTGVGTRSYFGIHMRYDLNEGFPLITTKETWFKGIVAELLWFLSGGQNIQPLVKQGVNFWNDWPFKKYKESHPDASIEEFINLIKTDDTFANEHGNLGPVYGKQWRDFSGVDQISNVIEQIKTNPNSRRLIVSAWNPPDVSESLLPPCHVLFQFYVRDGRLSCSLYQRSGDMFLGVPFNIASYALLTHLIARECGLGVGEFIHTIGDAHIYKNHYIGTMALLMRKPYPFPSLVISSKKNIFELETKDIKVKDYQCHPHIHGEIAV